MKKIIFICFFFVTFFGFSQEKSPYKKIYEFDEMRTNWAMVKTIANTYGFIDRNNKEVVPAIYSNIFSFELKENNKKYAMVKNVAGAYGFIDENGKEVVKAIFWNKEEAIQKLNLYTNTK